MNYYVLFVCCSLLHSCKNIPKKGKRTVGRVGISGQVGILRARGHAKSLVNGRLNRRNGKKKKTHERGCWTMGAQGRICGTITTILREPVVPPLNLVVRRCGERSQSRPMGPLSPLPRDYPLTTAAIALSLS